MNEEMEFRLRENRYEPSGVELDELKRRAMAGSARPKRARGSRSPRVVTSFLALALMLSGGSAVLASTSGSSAGSRPSASVSQYQLVLGEKVVPGSANLAAPTGCVSKVFFARVKGKQVAKVVFKLDGKTLKTFTKPNSGADFRVRIDPKKYRIGVHRIVATVITQNYTVDQDTNTVTRKDNQKPKTFRISFQRCAKKLAAPRFTG